MRAFLPVKHPWHPNGLSTIDRGDGDGRCLPSQHPSKQWPGSIQLLGRAESAPVADDTRALGSQQRESTPDGRNTQPCEKGQFHACDSVGLSGPLPTNPIAILFLFCSVTGLPVLCPANTFFSGSSPLQSLQFAPKLLPAPTAHTLAPTPKCLESLSAAGVFPVARGSIVAQTAPTLCSSARYRIPVPASRIPHPVPHLLEQNSVRRRGLQHATDGGKDGPFQLLRPIITGFVTGSPRRRQPHIRIQSYRNPGTP